MTINISQQTLEHFVPAFQTSDDQIFTRLQSFIDTEILALEQTLGEDIDTYFEESEKAREMATAFVCLRAARLAIPQLDLVLTQTGFGVVSTSNVAPASRERVHNLIEQMRKTESLTYDALLSNLIRVTKWRDTEYCQRVVNSLLWSANLVRQQGITFDKQTVYQDEFLQLLPQIKNAEMQLMEFVPEELYQKLVKSLRQPCDKLPEPYLMIRDYCTSYLCWCVIEDAMSCNLFRNTIIAYLDRHADEFPEYQKSEIYAARKVQRFENKKDNKCHFW